MEEDLTIKARLIDDVSGPARRAKAAVKELGDEVKRVQGRDGQGASLPYRRLTREVTASTGAMGRMHTILGRVHGALGKVGGEAQRLGNRMWSSIGNTASSAVRSLYGHVRTLVYTLGAAGSAATVFGIKAAGDMEMVGIAFETILGSKTAGDKFIAQMEQFAKITPFRFNDVAGAAKGMLAGGWKPDAILTDLRKIGDGAAAVGAPLQNIVAQIQQMKASESINWMDLRVLAQNGLPVLDILSKKMGMTVKDLKTTLSNPGGGAALFQKGGLDMLVDGIGERYSGMMDRQSKTFMGKMSNLLDAVSMGAAKLFRPLTDALKPLLDRVVPRIEATMKRMVAGATAFGQGFQVGGVRGGLVALDQFFGHGPKFAAMFDKMMPNLRGVWQFLRNIAGITWNGLVAALNGLKTAFQWIAKHKDVLTSLAIGIGLATVGMLGFAAALYLASNAPIVLITLAIVALVVGLVHAYRKVKWFRDAVNWLGRTAMKVFRWIDLAVMVVARWFQKAWNAASGFRSAVSRITTGALRAVGRAVMSVARWFQKAWNSTRDFREAVGRISQTTLRVIARAAQSVWNWIKKAASKVGEFIG